MEKEQIISILDKLDFFQGQRAGRELWNNKPFEVQEQDISDFSRDVALIKEYIKSQDEQIFKLENRLKECENGYSQTLGIERAEIKALTEENEKIGIENFDLKVTEGMNCSQLEELIIQLGKYQIINELDSIDMNNAITILINMLSQYSSDDNYWETIKQINERGVSLRIIAQAINVPHSTIQYRLGGKKK